MDAKRARGISVAFVAAVGLLAWQVLEKLLLAALPLPAYPGTDQTMQFFQAGLVASNALFATLPYAIGVFFSLAVIAPVGGALRLGHVITRSLLAVALGAAAAVVGALLVSFIYYLTAEISSVQDLSTAGERIGFALLSALRAGIETAIGAAAVTVLAGVLSWVWLRKRPTRQIASGKLDEV